MSGSGDFFISEEHIVTFTWINFTRILYFSRPFFTDENLEKKFYMSLDCLPSVFSIDLNYKEFNHMYQAFNKGLSYYREYMKSIDPLQKDEYGTLLEWKNLLEELKKDKRYYKNE